VLGPEFDAILDDARGGSRPALGAIYRDLYPGVLAYFRGRVPSEAEDLASEVFLDVAGGLHSFTGDEPGFRGWVFTIARRRGIDATRKATRRATTPVPLDVLSELPDRSDPAAEAVARLGSDDSIALLSHLTQLQADVVLLRVVAGLTVEETATAVGRRPGAVRVLQHRAIRRLAKLLGEQGRQGPGPARRVAEGPQEEGAEA
jgi:RNA polymerase sigma-70 factor (ECF subfamily)